MAQAKDDITKKPIKKKKWYQFGKGQDDDDDEEEEYEQKVEIEGLEEYPVEKTDDDPTNKCCVM